MKSAIFSLFSLFVSNASNQRRCDKTFSPHFQAGSGERQNQNNTPPEFVQAPSLLLPRSLAHCCDDMPAPQRMERGREGNRAASALPSILSVRPMGVRKQALLHHHFLWMWLRRRRRRPCSFVPGRKAEEGGRVLQFMTLQAYVHTMAHIFVSFVPAPSLLFSLALLQ